jgi:DNA-3-methyladenine glycosylase II
LNGIAANTILGRLVAACGKSDFPTPQAILDASTETLRAAGFSFAKVAALKDLAAKTLAAVVPDRATLATLEDAVIIERLTQVRGVGRWTVEMLLMFQLGRPDILPVDDFGVRAGFRAAYGLTRLPKPKVLGLWGERWKPYRSAAAWYLWRALELERAGKLPAPAQRVVLPRLPRKRRKARLRKRVPKRAQAATRTKGKRVRARARAAR